jgi:hypothetical protein
VLFSIQIRFPVPESGRGNRSTSNARSSWRAALQAYLRIGFRTDIQAPHLRSPIRSLRVPEARPHLGLEDAPIRIVFRRRPSRPKPRRRALAHHSVVPRTNDAAVPRFCFRPPQTKRRRTARLLRAGGCALGLGPSGPCAIRRRFRPGQPAPILAIRATGPNQSISKPPPYPTSPRTIQRIQIEIAAR